MKSPIRWVPTAYLAEGIPFALVAWTATTLFKDLGYGDGDITGPIGAIMLIWSLKPIYAGLLDAYRSKRFWVIACELFIAGTLVACSAALQLHDPYVPLLALLCLIAFGGATHDICVDGLYVSTLDPQAQARWIGWQGAFWTTGRIFSASAVVAVATYLQKLNLDAPRAWSIAFLCAGAFVAGLALLHTRTLPREPAKATRATKGAGLAALILPWRDFFDKPFIWGMLAFVLFFRFAEGFLLIETPLFMQGSVSEGGLGMCATSELTKNCPHFLSDRAAIEGFISTGISLVFGILGGKFAERRGLSNRLLLVMALCINVPTLSLVYLSQLAATGEPVPLWVIAALVSVEKAGYSFGFVANMLYMLQQIAPGKYPMTHLALCTAFMNAAIVPTQAASGHIAEALGYQTYFVFVCVTTLPSILVAWKAPLPHASPRARNATEAAPPYAESG